MSLCTAEAVAQHAVEDGMTEGRDSPHLKERSETHFWTPEYARYC
ncbi:hypothetical protein [Zymobacter sp. IVIA_12111.31 C1]